MIVENKTENTYLLREVLGTRFLTKYESKNLKKFLESCKNYYIDTNIMRTVDIQHCKFNPDNYKEIAYASDYTKFIDSHNPIIDNMLDHNSRVSKMRKLEKLGYIKVEFIPIQFEAKNMREYVSNLSRSKIYRLHSHEKFKTIPADASILIAMAIGYLHPDVSIDLSQQCSNYFRMFRRFWMYTGLVKRDSYNLLWEGNILKINSVDTYANGENVFYIPGVGEITEDILNKNFIVIPYDFGTKTKEELQEDPELKNIFEDITNELQVASVKKHGKKVTSELSTLKET